MLIKAIDVGDIQMLRGSVAVSAIIDRGAGQPTLDPEIERLSVRVISLEAEVQRLNEAVIVARSEGESEGRTQVKRDFDAQRAEAHVQLEAGLSHALEQWSAKLNEVDRLAVMIASTALERLLLSPEDRLSTLTALIAAQVQALDRSSLLRIKVSHEDFIDSDALAELAQSCAIDGVLIEQALNLCAGDCIIQLTLGSIDVGLNQQWSAIRSLLESHANGVMVSL